MTLIEQRNADYVAHFKSLMRQEHLATGCRVFDVHALIRKSLCGHPSHHFKEFSSCYQVVCGILRRRRRDACAGLAPDRGLTSLRTLYWSELADQVEEALERNSGSIASALEWVLNHRSPSSFYITEDYAMRLVRPLIRISRKTQFEML